MDVKWYLIVILICIVLMTNDEHLFMCASSSEKWLFRCFAHFKIRLFIFYYYCKSSLYILDSSPSSEIWFVKLFHKLYFSPSIFLYVLNNIFEDGNFPGSSDSKESTGNVGDPDSVPGSGRCSGERNGNPLQCSCLKNSMDRGAWPAIVTGCKELDMTEQLTLSLSNNFEHVWSIKLYIAPFSH